MDEQIIEEWRVGVLGCVLWREGEGAGLRGGVRRGKKSLATMEFDDAVTGKQAKEGVTNLARSLALEGGIALVALPALIAHGAPVKPELATCGALAAGGWENLGDDGPPLGHGHHAFPKTSFSTCRLSAWSRHKTTTCEYSTIRFG
jgi:hypothetical protein